MSAVAWPTVSLGEVLVRSENTIPLDAETTYKEVTVRMNGKGVVERRQVQGIEISSDRRFKASAGQFIISRIDARNGASGLIPEELDGAVVTNDFPLFHVTQDRLDPAFLGWMAKTASFIEQCKRASEGTTNRVRLSEDRFKALEIALPPLAEQRRIVSRIEKLAEKVKEARGLREKSFEETIALKDTHLRLLFDQLAKSPRIELGELCEVRGGIQKSPARAPGANPVRYITVAHVQRNRLDITDERYFEVSADELERWRLESGDVLIIEGNGSADQIGRACLFRGEIKNCVHQNHVIRLRPNRDRIDSEYLNLFLNSPAGRDEVQFLSRTTSGLRTLSVGRIKSIGLPVPALSEQHQLLEKVHAHFAILERLEELQAETAAELEAMLQAILGKAFKGEL